MIKEAIQKLVKKEDLSEHEAIQAMDCIMSGEAAPSQIGAFLAALRLKGETVDEITGCARVMREKAERIKPEVPFCVDTCGTGGDGAGTFNISTAAAIVAAAGGACVAKHGNRAMSGRSGSADVLEALGVNIMLQPAQVERCIEETGVGFMFAQSFHKAMKHAAGPRRELGFRTVFNILGPLTNPAGAGGQVMGVFDESLTDILAEVLRRLGSERALVVHGMDGLDEITITAATRISELKNGTVTTYDLEPLDLGIARPRDGIPTVDSAAASAKTVVSVLNGDKGAHRDIVVINAAAALYVGGVAGGIEDGIVKAAAAIDSGAALAKLEQLKAFTVECSQAAI